MLIHSLGEIPHEVQHALVLKLNPSFTAQKLTYIGGVNPRETPNTVKLLPRLTLVWIYKVEN